MLATPVIQPFEFSTAVFIDYRQDGSPFYVGIATYEQLKSKQIDNPEYVKIVASETCERDLHKLCTSKEEAISEATSLIKKFGKKLVNLTKGGAEGFESISTAPAPKLDIGSILASLQTNRQTPRERNGTAPAPRQRSGGERIQGANLADGELTPIFDRTGDATKWLFDKGLTDNPDKGASRIRKCCQGLRADVFGYSWKFV